MLTAQRDKKPVVLITMGDCNGIGPEVALKAASSKQVRRVCSPVLVGSMDVFEYYARRTKQKINLQEVEITSDFIQSDNHQIPVINLRPFKRPRISPGTVSPDAGAFAGEAIEVAAKLCLKHRAHAMITSPVSKESMHSGGYRYPGQTDMLAKLCGIRKFAMMLIAETFRVGLATIHVPLRFVHRSITKQRIFEKLFVIQKSLRQDFGITSPRIAVLGLNPHAGENGKLGHEEKQEIVPALRRAESTGMRVEGPFPADGFFGTHAHNDYDAVLAMYHDQGLVPLKISGFERGVNYTAGLPIVRTSPDHGTAFEIAGKGMANPTSMIEAIKLSLVIANNRRRGRK